MFVFIFEDVSQVSGRYHSDGGLVVVARDEAHVQDLVAQDPNIKLLDEDWKAVVKYPLAKEESPQVYVFPDAGCC